MIERLGKRHDRASFNCGQPMLDEWIKVQAGQYDKKDLARTYVSVRHGQARVLGYYAISTHRVSYESLPEDQAIGLPKIDIPVVLIGRLAVDRSVQRQGLGSLLLVDALRRSQHIAEQIGIRAVEVDAIDDEARAFYCKFDFASLLDDPHHLFLPMRVIRKLGLSPLTEPSK